MSSMDHGGGNRRAGVGSGSFLPDRQRVCFGGRAWDHSPGEAIPYSTQGKAAGTQPRWRVCCEFMQKAPRCLHAELKRR